MPSPTAAALTAWIDMTAWPSTPSRRSRQETCEPRPGTRPKARTSNTPPSDSLALRRRVDLGDHRARSPPGPGSAPATRRRRRSPRDEVVAAGRRDRRDLDHVREDLHAHRAQELLGQRATGHSGSRLTGAGALEDVAHVAQAVLLGADEIGMAGAGQVDLGRLGVDRPRVHPLLPVGEVAVGHLQRDRAAERAAVAHAAGDGRPCRARSSSVRRGRGRAAGVPDRGPAPRARAPGPAGRPSTMQVRPGAVRLAGGCQLEAPWRQLS